MPMVKTNHHAQVALRTTRTVASGMVRRDAAETQRAADDPIWPEDVIARCVVRGRDDEDMVHSRMTLMSRQA